MNKQITLIAGIVVLIGLGALAAFNKIDLETFGSISVAVLGAIWGFYNKFENKELKTENETLELEVEGFMAAHNHMVDKTRKMESLNTSLVDSLKESNKKYEDLQSKIKPSEVVIEPVITKEDAVEVTESLVKKPSKRRKK